MAVIQKLRCLVERIEDHGDHVYTVDLRPERPAPRFQPGQFLHLALDDYDPSGFWPDSRVFSIASSPRERDRLRISYSVRGRFTARMERELCPQRNVWVKLPYGEFVIDGTKDAVLIAGGTGITAFAALLGLLDASHGRNVLLAYGARRRSLLIYHDLVSRCLDQVARFRAQYFVESPADPVGGTDGGGSAAGEGKSVSTAREVCGRVALDPIWHQIREPFGAIYDVSGPPQMVATVSGDLRTRGIADGCIRVDAWE